MIDIRTKRDYREILVLKNKEISVLETIIGNLRKQRFDAVTKEEQLESELTNISVQLTAAIRLLKEAVKADKPSPDGLDSDDVYLPWWLSDHVKPFIENPVEHAQWILDYWKKRDKRVASQ